MNNIMSNKSIDFPIFNELEFDAIKMYNRDINFYHNIHHIYNMLVLANKDIDYIKEITDADCFLTAILFHDVIYVTNDKKNEFLSAEMFKKCFEHLIENNTDLQISEHQIKKDLISQLIMSTKFGAKLETKAEQLLHDYDYMNFTNQNQMILADKQIVNEAIRDGFLSISRIIYGRLEFYRSLIKQGYIFVSEKYQHLNNIALNNILGLIENYENTI